MPYRIAGIDVHKKMLAATTPQSSGKRRGQSQRHDLRVLYRRLVPRLGHAQAIGAIAHRLCRLIWKILRQGIRYEERGAAVSTEAKNVRTRKMIRELRTLGYRVERLPAASNSPA